ncbi:MULTISPECIES: DUF3617 family protein [unclassified Thioalkalivibrio]|uniref:DUF3617 domain-containing protein n=1 Tax=unclassified Thioalkalivibrio TaxID=2621013 RepID=UPI00037D847B|nr:MULTISPECIES: DUF3617 family protein [unclassified Thioalkalivibrio]
MLRFLIPLALLALPVAAQAETPNLEPGEWEYTHTTTIEGMPQMQDQVEVTRECVTQEDIEKGEDVIEVPEECTLDHVDVRSDGADFAMTCTDPQGGRATMEGEMRFMGTRSEGTMTTDVDSPMGPMTIIMEIEGERIGDC